MKTVLDIYQELILKFLEDKQNSWEDEWITLKEIWEQVGIDHPQKVSNKLQQLEKKGFLKKWENWIYRVIKNQISKITYIPVYWFAQCGIRGRKITTEYPKKYYPLESDFVKNWSDVYFGITAKGSSMEPKIEAGDLLIIKQQNTFFENNIVLITHNKEAKIKQIKKKDDIFFLHSLNWKFEDVEILKEDEIEILWILKRIIKNID